MSDGGPEQSYSGRLELTWTNKDQRLLAHEDGSYEWLPPNDPEFSGFAPLREDDDVVSVTHVRPID